MLGLQAYVPETSVQPLHASSAVCVQPYIVHQVVSRGTPQCASTVPRAGTFPSQGCVTPVMDHAVSHRDCVLASCDSACVQANVSGVTASTHPVRENAPPRRRRPSSAAIGLRRTADAAVVRDEPNRGMVPSAVGESGAPPQARAPRGLVTLDMFSHAVQRRECTPVAGSEPPKGVYTLSSCTSAWAQVQNLQREVAHATGAAHTLVRKGFQREADHHAAAAIAASARLHTLTGGRGGLAPPEAWAPVSMPAVAQCGRGGKLMPSESAAPHLQGLSEVVLQHIAHIYPQLQHEEVDKVRAARALYRIMSPLQVARFQGASVVELVTDSASEVESSFVLTAIEEWSAQRMDAFRRTWADVLGFAERGGFRIPVGGKFSGRFVDLYLRGRDLRAKAQFRQRHAGRQIPAGSAQGSTAKGGVGSLLRTLGSKLHFPIDVTSVTARVATKRRTRGKQRIMCRTLSVRC